MGASVARPEFSSTKGHEGRLRAALFPVLGTLHWKRVRNIYRSTAQQTVYEMRKTGKYTPEQIQAVLDFLNGAA